MKNIKLIALLLCIFSLCTAFSFKKKEKKDPTIYMCGFSASFSDSLVFITNIQAVDGAKLDKNGFLINRQQYSYQLKSYLESKKDARNATCFVMYSSEKKAIMNKSNKLLNKYEKGHMSIIKTVNEPEFKFTEPQDEENSTDEKDTTEQKSNN